MAIRVLLILLALVGLVVLFGLPNVKSEKPSKHDTGSASELPSRLPTSSSPSSQQPTLNAATATATPSPQQKPGIASPEQIRSVLEKHSPAGQNWEVETDALGHSVRMSGGGLKAMGSGAESIETLNSLAEALGLSKSNVFERKAGSSGRFEMVDYFQSHPLNDGSIAPVFNAWIRFKGTTEGGASMVINQLKPLNPRVQLNRALTDEDAVSLARAQFSALPNSTFIVVAPVVIWADSEPHQLATQVDVQGPLPHWRLLIGHQSRTIIHSQVMTRN